MSLCVKCIGRSPNKAKQPDSSASLPLALLDFCGKVTSHRPWLWSPGGWMTPCELSFLCCPWRLYMRCVLAPGQCDHAGHCRVQLGSSFILVFSLWNWKVAEMFGLQMVKNSLISNYAAFLACTFESTSKAWLSRTRRALYWPIPWVFSWGACALGL